MITTKMNDWNNLSLSKYSPIFFIFISNLFLLITFFIKLYSIIILFEKKSESEMSQEN